MGALEEDFNYQDGVWTAQSIRNSIENTTFGSLENAIRVKQGLVEQFEKEFGYSRDQDEFPDRNYTFNLGMLDELIKIYEEEQNTN